MGDKTGFPRDSHKLPIAEIGIKYRLVYLYAGIGKPLVSLHFMTSN